MNLSGIRSGKQRAHSTVPPIFAAAGQRDRQASPPSGSEPSEEGTRAPSRPEDSTPSGDALNDTGEDNQRQKEARE
ncbi:hypothetical protein [Frateuria defendens]|uniref:hypothetical protein n=1 Tax=Frateuria defendens TaxID=2219559 RepID=UPI00066FE898|nr:hypothetical protein [Frateuria defendens]